MLPVFMRSEHFHRTAEGHGREGEMRIERQRLRWPILDAVREAAAEIGIAPNEPWRPVEQSKHVVRDQHLAVAPG